MCTEKQQIDHPRVSIYKKEKLDRLNDDMMRRGGRDRSLKGMERSSRGVISLNDRGPEWNLNRIFGRDAESQIIQNHIDKLSTGTIIVKGFSGSGKSSLVESQNFEEDGWFFSAGKYEERRRQEPYSALIDAIDYLVEDWKIDDKNASTSQMESFRKLINQDLQFMEPMLPKAFDEVKGYKAKAGSSIRTVSDIGSEAISDARAINSAFWKILSFICELKPVVLFLDDIQWADQASLDTITFLSSTGNISGFLLILSYRLEEVFEGDNVFQSLKRIKNEGERVETIHVTDLDAQGTNRIVSSILEHDLEQTSQLTKVIHRKTAGNPFFVVQFIQILRHECFLQYNFMKFEWEWGNIDEIDNLSYISDNVANIIAGSMKKLSEPCLFALQVASCLGKVIHMQVMIEHFGRCTEEGFFCDTLHGIRLKGLRQLLDEAVNFGILKPLDDNESLVWAHDKLQHVAYSMIPATYRQMAHKSLGMILWKIHKLNPEDEWVLYMAADQLNRLTEVTDDDLRRNIADLSFQGGQISISKAAFFPGKTNFI